MNLPGLSGLVKGKEYLRMSRVGEMRGSAGVGQEAAMACRTSLITLEEVALRFGRGVENRKGAMIFKIIRLLEVFHLCLLEFFHFLDHHLT